jgi:hypothetical protein
VKLQFRSLLRGYDDVVLHFEESSFWTLSIVYVPKRHDVSETESEDVNRSSFRNVVFFRNIVRWTKYKNITFTIFVPVYQQTYDRNNRQISYCRMFYLLWYKYLVCTFLESGLGFTFYYHFCFNPVSVYIMVSFSHCSAILCVFVHEWLTCYSWRLMMTL